MPRDRSASLYDALRRLTRRARSRDQNAVCGYGITVRECHALELLAGQPLSVNGLAAALGLDKSTASRLVQHLVEEKLASRKADQRDSRAVFVTLTAKGKKVYEAALDDSLKLYAALLERIPAARRDEVVDSLELIARLLEESR